MDQPTLFDIPATVPSKPARPQWSAEKRAIIEAVAKALRRVNAPPIGPSGKDILATLTGSLLSGGYALDLIQNVAVNSALEYNEVRRYSKLFQLRMRVIAEQSRIDQEEHARKKREAARDIIPADPAVAIAMLNAAKRAMRGQDGPRAEWSVQCSSCTRTAIYASTTCADHQRETPTP